MELAVGLAPIALFLDVWLLAPTKATAPALTVALAIALSGACATLIGAACWRERRALVERAREHLRRRETQLIGGLLVMHAAIKLPYLDLVPRWDAGTYFGAVVEAAAHFDGTAASFASSFRFFDHPTNAVGAYWAMAQLVAPMNFALINVEDLLLCLLTLAAFASLVGRLFPNNGPIERVLLVAAFAASPLFFASSIGMNADLGMIAFFTCALAALAAERPVLLAASGLYLCFSKETGFLLYGALFGGAALARAKEALRDKRVLVAGAVALTPILAYQLFHAVMPKNHWTADSFKCDSGGLYCFGFSDAVFFRVLGEAVVLDFAWIPTLAWLAYLLRSVVARKTLAPAEKRETVVLVRIALLVFGSFLLVNCLYKNFINPRYVVALVPVTLIVFLYALNRHFSAERTRLALLSTFVLLSLAQIWWTVDPVSRVAFGTFDGGDSRLLDVPGPSQPHQSRCDGMAYNAQYAGVARLYEQMNHRVFAGGRRPIVLFGMDHPWVLFYNRLPIDAATLDFTFHGERAFAPMMAAVDRVTPANAPPFIVYAAIPWLDDTDAMLKRLTQIYRVTNDYRLSSSGLALHVYELGR